MVNTACAAAHTRASQGPRKPPGAHGPFTDPKRPPWSAHPLGASSEPPNSPTPVKWIGHSTVTVTSEHPLNVTSPTDIDPLLSVSPPHLERLSRT
jgi:hypothetical protein